MKNNTPTVTVYSSDSCGYCHKAKAFLRENGVVFIEKKVDSDPLAQAEMRTMKAQGVPVIKVDDEIIMGFDQARLEALFGKKIITCPQCSTQMRVPKREMTIKVTCPACKEVFQVDLRTLL